MNFTSLDSSPNPESNGFPFFFFFASFFRTGSGPNKFSYWFTDSAGFDAFPAGAGGAPGAAEAVGAGVDGGAGSDDCIIDYSFFSTYFFNFNSSIF